MKRRNNLDLNGSLEMFLDTICNTFGGILFILLFVIILLKSTQEKRNELDSQGVSPVEFAAMESELTQLQQEWEIIRQELEGVMNQNAKIYDAKSLELYQAWQKLQKENADVTKKRIANATTTARLDKEISELHEQQKTLEKQLKRERTELEQARAERDKNQAQLEADMKTKREDTSMPVMSRRSLTEIGLVLRYNRLYLWHEYDALGYPRGLNVNDFTIVKEEGEIVYSQPRPWRGIPLLNNPKLEQEVKTLLSKFSPSEHSLTLLTMGDSFEGYDEVESVMKQLGFHITPWPMKLGSGVVDRGGSGQRSQ